MLRLPSSPPSFSFCGGESPFPRLAHACGRMPRVNSWNWIKVPTRQVHCLGNLSYKWQNESTLHGSLSTCCCVTHHCRYGGREKKGEWASNVIKDHTLNCFAVINSDVTAALFVKDDIKTIHCCKEFLQTQRSAWMCRAHIDTASRGALRACFCNLRQFAVMQEAVCTKWFLLLTYLQLVHKKVKEKFNYLCCRVVGLIKMQHILYKNLHLQSIWKL